MKPVFLKILFGFLGILFFSSLKSQTEKVAFSYYFDNKIHKGYFHVVYKLIENSNSDTIPNIIGYAGLSYSAVTLSAEFFGVKWGAPDHASLLRLAFLPELSEQGDGVFSNRTTGFYLSSNGSQKWTFGIGPPNEVASTMIMTNFIVIKKDYAPTAINKLEDAIRNENCLGFGIATKPFLLRPEYDDNSLGDLELQYSLWESVNNSLEKEMSYQIAKKIKDEQYGDLDDILENPAQPDLKNTRAVSSNNFTSKKGELDPIGESKAKQGKFSDPEVYGEYPAESPNETYANDAAEKNPDTRPFRYEIQKTGNDFTIEFTAGAGAYPPDLSLSDNGDYAIKYKWISPNKVKITLPRDRKTRALFTQGGKREEIALENGMDPVNAKITMAGNKLSVKGLSGGSPPYSLELYLDSMLIAQTALEGKKEQTVNLKKYNLNGSQFIAKVKDARGVYSPPFEAELAGGANPAGPGKNKKWMFLLALPILAVSGYILYKRFFYI